MFFKYIFLFLVVSFNYTFAFQIQDNEVINLKKKWIKNGKKAYFKKDIDTLSFYTQKIDSLFHETKDSILLAKYYHFKALENRVSYKYDSTFYYYNESKKISKLLKDSLNMGMRLLSIASVQRKVRDFLGSEITSIEALKYLEPLKANKYLERVYNNLGIVSKELNEKEEALKSFEKALRYNKLNKNNKGWFDLMNNIGLSYYKNEEHKEAIEYFKKGLVFDSIQMKYPTKYALLLENLTISELNLGNKTHTLENYQKVLDIRKKEKDLFNISGSYCLFSEFYMGIKDYKKAEISAQKALKYAKQTHNNKRWLESLRLLSELHTGKKATNYLKEYISLNDSLLTKERATKNQFAKIIYETDQKEKENIGLKIENQKIEAEVVYHKQQKTIGWLLFVASLFGLGFSILFFISRRRRLIYNNQLQKIQAREKERKNIAKSLHDEVAGDLRLMHQKLQKSQLYEEAEKLEMIKENVRGLSHKLSSISFEKVSFKNQVINLVSDYFEPTFKIQVKGINEHQWTAVDTTIKRLLYLSMRECMQNCQKYAKATKVILDFSIRKKDVFLSIIDNGIGFDTNTQKKGIGLHNLEERLEELNGTLNIDSEPNKGTKIYIQIPLNVYKNKNTYR